MFFRLTKRTPNVFSQSLKYALRPSASPIKRFSSLTSPSNSPLEVPIGPDYRTPLDSLPSQNVHITSYMRDFYQYLAAASVVGISSAHLLSLVVPMGTPSAFLIVAGFGLHHIGEDYIDKIRPKMHLFQGVDGNFQHSNKNPGDRKLAFLASTLGYGCIIGALLGMVPVATSALPLSLITCLFSTLGHLTYCKFAPKKQFKPYKLLISGLLTGILGMNLVTAGSTILMWENPLNLESLEVSTYIGTFLYNAFTSYESKKIVEDIQTGKGDYLKHASQFAENWLYALIPYFMFFFYTLENSM